MVAPYTFRPALREQTSLLIGIAGASGSGKTASGLKLARGILGGKDDGIFMIDTEANRGLHYACSPGEQPGDFRFKFQHLRMEPPFSPLAYQEAIGAAVKAGAKLVFVDSMSHEHEGQGGILEWHERELDRMAGQEYGKRERMTFAAWIKPKAAHNQFVNFILQQPCHFIFAFRAKDKMKLVKVVRDGRERTEPIQLGWTPICSDRFEYEMTTLLMLPPNARGVPDLTLEATKINAHHVSFFPAGQPISEKAGEQLAAWAAGGAVPAKPAKPKDEPKPASRPAPVTPKTEPPDAQADAFPPAEKSQPAPKPDATAVPGIDTDDESQALAKDIEAEKAKLERQPSGPQWERICTVVAGTAILEMADPSALSDLLAFLRALVAKDPEAIARARKILKAEEASA